MPQYLSQQDYNDYGPDLVNFAQCAAADAIAPQIQFLDQQNAELRQRLAVEARRNLNARVEKAVPNYQEIDRDPRWHSWLLGTDILSGRARQVLLNDAIQSGDASRIANFFRKFLAEAGGAQSASYPSGRTSASGGAVYTRPQIQQLYEAHRKGRYAGREAEWNRIEQDIIAAGREERVLNPDRITK